MFISSDRTQYQREYMKKLRENLASRFSNGENGLTIKFIEGVPKIVSKSDFVVNSSQRDTQFF